MVEKLNFAIAGVGGRMGRQLVTAALEAGHEITGGSEVPGSSDIGKDIGSFTMAKALGVSVKAGISEVAKGAQVWIDFTVPSAALSALAVAPTAGVRTFIIGTTGFTAAQEADIVAAAERLTIVKAGNFSLGVNLLEALVQQAAIRLGSDWDIEILETHHRRKLDAPSGTALMLGDAAAAGRNKTLSDIKAEPYNGAKANREVGEIGFSVRRSGGVIGDHEVTFGSDMEILSLRHTALDRAVFAYGAIKAAEWAFGQAPGLYGMNDVLGLT